MLVEVSSRRFEIPFECPCCGAAPDTEIAIPLVRTNRELARDTAHSMIVPYCRRCAAHVARWESVGVASAGILLVGLIAGIVFALAVHVAVGTGVFVVSVPVAWYVRELRRKRAARSIGESCAGPGRAISYLGWSGTTTAFELASHAYAARFAEANPNQLANHTSQLRVLLEGHRVARLAVPSAAQETVPPPATIDEWVARLRATKGVVERRQTLQRALDGLTDLAQRQVAIQTATELEVAPVLADLEGLTQTAKRQRLQRSIDDVRADNIPEALQAAVLFQLENELRGLGDS